MTVLFRTTPEQAARIDEMIEEFRHVTIATLKNRAEWCQGTFELLELWYETRDPAVLLDLFEVIEDELFSERRY